MPFFTVECDNRHSTPFVSHLQASEYAKYYGGIVHEYLTLEEYQLSCTILTKQSSSTVMPSVSYIEPMVIEKYGR